MPTAETVSLGTRVYLDSNVFIYLIEGSGRITDVVATLFRRLKSVGARLVTSDIAVAECLRGPAARAVDAAAEEYRAFFADVRQLEIVPVTSAIVRRTIDLPQFKLVDALHAATALEAGCDLFVTNDRAFASLAQPRVLVVGDLIRS